MSGWVGGGGGVNNYRGGLKSDVFLELQVHVDGSITGGAHNRGRGGGL